MKTPLLRLAYTSVGAVIVSLAAAPLLQAQTDAEEAEPAATAVSAELFDALSIIQGMPGDAYSVDDAQRIFRAVWWDVTFDDQEIALARQLNGTTRPVAITGADGRSLSFTKVAAPDAMRQQRFLLPSHFSPNDSTYFVHAFNNTKSAGVFIGACRVHENARDIMETSLNDMINQARFRAKTGGDKVILELFAELEAGYRDANPAIRGEFADAVRRIVARYSSDSNTLPKAVREAAWLQPPA